MQVMLANIANKAVLVAALIFAAVPTLAVGEIYKYRDVDGNWKFTDKKPESKKENKVEVLDYKKRQSKSVKPKLDTQRSDLKTTYSCDNPLPVEIQCFIWNKDRKEQFSSITAPFSKSEIHHSKDKKPLKFQFGYLLGNPASEPEDYLYLPPFTSYKPMLISQGFKGKFSHYRRPNKYAVDIATPVGTKISAARGGIVVSTKDDYPIGGVSSPFFLDKANYVIIMHDDQTYATYAHLLLGRIGVEVGDRVEAGDVIGISGNTGYSSGPHLHFVIRHNKQGKNVSIPFKFAQPKSQKVTPKFREYLLPLSSSK